MIVLDAKRNAVLQAQGHVLVLGGPGSGKTTIALLKAHRDIVSNRLKAGQRILFLSFARATVARVAQHAKGIIGTSQMPAIEINTYHGFFWSVLRAHGYLLRVGGLRLLPPPEAASHLTQFPVAQRGQEKERLFLSDGLIHFDLFASKCEQLLRACAKLRDLICDLYPVIILDEFQDTNSEEWKIIKSLGNKSELLALADADQRIYEFRGDRPGVLLPHSVRDFSLQA